VVPGLCFVGVPVDDPEVNSLSRRVVWLSSLSALCILAEGCYSSFATGNMGFIFVAVFTLMIPACGHLGVLQKSKDYLCCFCGWSFVCFVIGLVNLMVLAIVLGGSLEDSSTLVWILHIGFALVSTIIYFLSFHFGKILHQNEHFEPNLRTEGLIHLEFSTIARTGAGARGGNGRAPPPPLLTGSVVTGELRDESGASEVPEEPCNQPQCTVQVDIRSEPSNEVGSGELQGVSATQGPPPVVGQAPPY